MIQTFFLKKNKNLIPIFNKIRNLELLKLKFGETSLHLCEVMLKDIADSKRIDNHIHSNGKEKNVYFLFLFFSFFFKKKAFFFSFFFFPKKKKKLIFSFFSIPSFCLAYFGLHFDPRNLNFQINFKCFIPDFFFFHY